MSNKNKDHIVIYDGDCPFCASTAKFFEKKDKRKQFLFLPGTYSDSSDEIKLKEIQQKSKESVLLINGDKVLWKSDAVIQMLVGLGGINVAFKILFLVPKVIRDFIYTQFSRNRHRIFRANNNVRNDS